MEINISTATQNSVEKFRCFKFKGNFKKLIFCNKLEKYTMEDFCNFSLEATQAKSVSRHMPFFYVFRRFPARFLWRSFQERHQREVSWRCFNNGLMGQVFVKDTNLKMFKKLWEKCCYGPNWLYRRCFCRSIEIARFLTCATCSSPNFCDFRPQWDRDQTRCKKAMAILRGADDSFCDNLYSKMFLTRFPGKLVYLPMNGWGLWFSCR